MATTKGRVRIAAVADLHYSKTSQGVFQPLFGQINESADVMLICGDLTDYGLPEEAQRLAKELAATVRIPIVAVLGNHDYESGRHQEVQKIFTEIGMRVLDGDTVEVHGVGFAGVKGFAGGFGRGTLGAWGEESVKRFVHEAVEESLKLENALARLRNPQRVAVLHYSPIRATVEGEPLEIFPFLGCSRLEEPLTRYPVSAVFHGHAHHGRLEGRTTNGIAVYNVSLPLLRATFPERPFYLVDIETADAARPAAGPGKIAAHTLQDWDGIDRRRTH